MNGLQEIIHEQFLEYSETLKELEKEIIRKYKAGEDYSADVTRAAGLKMLKEECIRMMVEKR
jgi:predicted DNA-binding ArsR family transcriptional regulator